MARYSVIRNRSRRALRFMRLARGAGSVMQVMPARQRTSISTYRLASSDTEAIRQDWQRVGQDLFESMNHFANERNLND